MKGKAELLAAMFVSDYSQVCKQAGKVLGIDLAFDVWAKVMLRDKGLRDKVQSIVFKEYLRRDG